MSQKVYFKTQKVFYQYLDALIEKFDYQRSFKYSRYTFADTEGQVYVCKTLQVMLTHLNGLINSEEEYFDLRGSRIKGVRGYSLIINDDTPIELRNTKTLQAKVEEVVETVPVEPEAPLVSLEAPEAAVEEVKEEVEVVEPVEVKDTPVVDWERINALKGSADDKKWLDDYAEKHFNIKLKRNMKLENMIAVFKEELAKL